MLQFEIRFTTYGIRVTQLDNGEIRCWKYTNSRYEFEVYTDIDSAIDFITTEPPSLEWWLEIVEC